MRNLFIFIFLLSTLVGYGQLLGIIAESGGNTGRGTLLWSQDFDTCAINASVSEAEIIAIIGAPTTVYNFDDNGQQQIIQYAVGDMSFSGKMDLGGQGGSGGWQIDKILRADAGAASNLDSLTELWMSFNVWFPEGFDNSSENADGKMPGGFRGSYAFFDYTSLLENFPPPATTEADFIDGFLLRDYYQDGSPINSPRNLKYSKDMTAPYGNKTGPYYKDWPENDSSSTKLSTTPQNVAIRLRENTDAGTYDGVVEVYIDERLHYSEYGRRWRVSDTVFIDWALWSFFPNSSTPTTDDYLCVIDDLHLFTFTPGDSTLTGVDTMDSSFDWTIDAPGYPKGEDLTDWGKFN